MVIICYRKDTTRMYIIASLERANVVNTVDFKTIEVLDLRFSMCACSEISLHSTLLLRSKRSSSWKYLLMEPYSLQKENSYYPSFFTLQYPHPWSCWLHCFHLTSSYLFKKNLMHTNRNWKRCQKPLPLLISSQHMLEAEISCFPCKPAFQTALSSNCWSVDTTK